MLLDKRGSIFNLGDTSFRRKQIIDDYRTVLICLVETLDLVKQWNSKNESQLIFYKKIAQSGIVDSSLIEKYYRALKNDIDVEMEHSAKKYLKQGYSGELSKQQNVLNYLIDDQKKRSRTYTNSLVKIGFVNKKREITKVGSDFLAYKIQKDSLEKALPLETYNIIFLRQLMKLRIYDKDESHYYYPFRVALFLLSRYSEMNENDFMYFILLIQPFWKNDFILYLVDEYQKVIDKKITSNEFFSSYFDFVEEDNDEYEKALNLYYSEEDIDMGDFALLFHNRRSGNVIQIYYRFYELCHSFTQDPTDYNLKAMLSLSKNDQIKKAFGYRSKVFKEKRNMSVEEFFKLNENHQLFVGDFKKSFLGLFVDSKRYDLIYEYKEINRRILKTAGIVGFKNKLVKLEQEWLKYIFGNLKFTNHLSGFEKESFSKYEEEEGSHYLSSKSVMTILDITEKGFLDVINEVREENSIPPEQSIEDYFKDKYEKDFVKLINDEFPNHRLVNLLKSVQSRNDNYLYKEVTDSATIPTIFEYLVAIVFYRISEGSCSLKDSMMLSLDANYLPLTHAPGGEGDILIQKEEYSLLIETTLMDSNTQKRGELEPVIRHATNLSARSSRSYTFFVANELDTNVINIFRSIYYAELQSSLKKDLKTTNVVIFSFTIEEVIELLAKNIKLKNILQVVESSYGKDAHIVKIGWRDEIMESILSGLN